MAERWLGEAGRTGRRQAVSVTWWQKIQRQCILWQHGKKIHLLNWWICLGIFLGRKLKIPANFLDIYDNIQIER